MLANGGSGWLPIEIIVRENIWDFGKNRRITIFFEQK
jgi:hypothetical protein